MKIFFLCKRRYMGHDVIKDRYGRLYFLPYELSRRGHRVAGICLNYYEDDECMSWRSNAPLTWSSFNAGTGGQAALAEYQYYNMDQVAARALSFADRIIRQFRS